MSSTLVAPRDSFCPDTAGTWRCAQPETRQVRHARKRVARTRLKHTSGRWLRRGWDAAGTKTRRYTYARNERGPTIKEDNYVDQYHYY